MKGTFFHILRGQIREYTIPFKIIITLLQDPIRQDQWSSCMRKIRSAITRTEVCRKIRSAVTLIEIRSAINGTDVEKKKYSFCSYLYRSVQKNSFCSYSYRSVQKNSFCSYSQRSEKYGGKFVLQLLIQKLQKSS